jgi:hypothetical protein
LFAKKSALRPMNGAKKENGADFLSAGVNAWAREKALNAKFFDISNC